MHLVLALLIAAQTPPAPAAPATAPAPPPPVNGLTRPQLRVLAINDFHGAVEPAVWPWSGGRPVGGAPALKSWLDSLARACGCPSIRLDGGDEMQGTLISNYHFGRPAIAAMNAFGIDAAVIGNHEFDWSVDTLRARMAGAHYRFLAANITDAAHATRPEWTVPWTVIERGGMKVAVIGVALPETPVTTTPANVRGLTFGDGVGAVRQVLPHARIGTDFVIVVAHIGAFCDGAAPGAARPVALAACHGEIVDLARGLDSGSVDLIVSGHTHSLVNTVVHGIPIVQARSSGTGIAVVDFVTGADSRRVVAARIETPFADQVRPDAVVEDSLRPYAQAIAALTSRPIARVRGALRREGDEYGLGRLIADAQRAIAGADVAIVNNGGIRADLEAGLATYGDLYRVEPFQDRLLRLTVTGAVLRQALEHVVAGPRAAAHLAGIAVWYDPRERPGHRLTSLRLANGQDVQDGARYTVAVSDYLAGGGGGYAMLVDAPRADVGVTDLDALIQYLSGLAQPVDPPTDARLHAAGAAR